MMSEQHRIAEWFDLIAFEEMGDREQEEQDLTTLEERFDLNEVREHNNTIIVRRPLTKPEWLRQGIRKTKTFINILKHEKENLIDFGRLINRKKYLLKKAQLKFITKRKYKTIRL